MLNPIGRTLAIGLLFLSLDRLSAEDYASIMAYVLSYDCVKPAGGGKTPFPTKDKPELAKVTVGGKSCPPAAEEVGAR